MNETFISLWDRLDLPFAGGQGEILQRLLGNEPVVTWSDWISGQSAKFVVVDDVPRWSDIHTMRRLLSPETTIVIPMSENPRFDSLKSHLHCHGVIGAAPPHAPHQIWWGGRDAATGTKNVDLLRGAHVVTCIPEGPEGDTAAEILTNGLDTLGMSYTIERAASRPGCQPESAFRSTLLLKAWEQTAKPLVWLDPSFDKHFSNLRADLVYADFAAIPLADTTLATSILYFGRSSISFDLLHFWNDLCLEFHHLPAAYLLDAAWAAAVSQRALVTVWIPAGGNTSSTATTTHIAPSSTPAQREGRNASRTGVPEPHCVLNSTNPGAGRGTVTLVISSEGATARDVALTMRTAVRAFTRDSGAFRTLGLFVVKDMHEAATAATAAPTGWSLFVSPGVQFAEDIFATLSKQADADHPIFIQPKWGDVPAAAKDINIQITKSQAVFCKAELIEKGAWKSRPRPELRLIGKDIAGCAGEVHQAEAGH